MTKKNRSPSLVLVAAIAAVAGCFAACSSSSSDGSAAPSAGSAGEAGSDGLNAVGGAAGDDGSSGHPSGGASALVAGDSGLGGDGTGASAATSGAAGVDETGGTAGDANGVSGGSGNPGGGSSAGGLSNGGSAGSGAGGSAGNQSGGTGATGAGGGAAGDDGAGCGLAAHTAFADGLVAYFLANVAKHDCFTPETVGSGPAAINECAGNGCSGSAGCASNFVWHDAAYDASTGQFTVQVDISSSVTLTLSPSAGGATCALDAEESNSPIAGEVTALDTGTALKAQLNTLSFHPGSSSTSGCSTVPDLATLSADITTTLRQRAAEDAVTTLGTYQVACGP